MYDQREIALIAKIIFRFATKTIYMLDIRVSVIAPYTDISKAKLDLAVTKDHSAEMLALHWTHFFINLL